MEAAKKTGPKDVFLHLFAIIALYTSVVSLGALIFNLINVYFPDPLDYQYYWYSAKSALRWPLATLTVIFPLYLWANIFLQKDALANPAKKELKVRKWLLYLTLFVAAGVIAGDLVTLILKYLEGELTVRFLLKVLTVLLTAASVFLYYGWSVKKDTPATKDSRMNIFVKSAVLAVLVAVLFGYYTAGSPQAERQRRFDERRISDLQQIQWQITEFWRVKEKLPDSLEELRDELRGFIPPKDPETGEMYEYGVKSEFSFELCAGFKTSSDEELSRVGVPQLVPYENFGNETWTHDAGRACFERTIDPDFFPPYPETGTPEFRKPVP